MRGSPKGRCPARPAQLLPRHVRWTRDRFGGPDIGAVIAGTPTRCQTPCGPLSPRGPLRRARGSPPQAPGAHSGYATQPTFPEHKRNLSLVHRMARFGLDRCFVLVECPIRWTLERRQPPDSAWKGGWLSLRLIRPKRPPARRQRGLSKRQYSIHQREWRTKALTRLRVANVSLRWPKGQATGGPDAKMKPPEPLVA